MGGFGSGGYYRSKNVYADESMCLDVNRMVKLGAIPKHGYRTGKLVWTHNSTSEEKSSIGYTVDTLNEEQPYIKLAYRIISSDEQYDYKINLIKTRPYYGGERLWFVCPVRGHRTAKLYLPYGGNLYASRQAYGLKYATQSMCPASRAIERKWRIVRKTNGDNYPVRPKGMHDKTFYKIMEEFWQAEQECDNYLMAMFGKYIGKK